MYGHVIISHGLNSSPASPKAVAMAAAVERLGWTSERPDYSDIDASGDLRDVKRRLERLIDRCEVAPRPLVLAGSSMGAFISALATLDVRCAGLFLLVPPVKMDGFGRALNAAKQPTMVVHAWHDEICPVGDVIRWAQRRHDRLLLLDDSHRLERHVDLVAAELARFVEGLA